MAITYDEKTKIFKLDSAHTSYMIGIVDQEQFVGHIYYGAKLRMQDALYLMRTEENPFVPSVNNRERCSFMDTFPMEYPGHGAGDYREGCIRVRTKEGHSVVSLTYQSHEIVDGKPALEGLPASFAKDGECQTLILTCRDQVLGLEAELLYSVFEKEDVITRSVRIINAGEQDIYLTKVYSACIDMDDRDYEWRCCMVLGHVSARLSARRLDMGNRVLDLFAGKVLIRSIHFLHGWTRRPRRSKARSMQCILYIPAILPHRLRRASLIRFV